MAVCILNVGARWCWSASCTSCCNAVSSMYWIGRLVCFRAGLDIMEKRNISCRARIH